jgi:hypothetical protein
MNTQEVVGWTGLHIASATRDLNIAELLIDSGTNVDSRNGKQKTTLDLASGNAKLEMARFLIGEVRPYLPGMTEAGHHSTQHQIVGISMLRSFYWSVISTSTFGLKMKRHHYTWHLATGRSTSHASSSNVPRFPLTTLPSCRLSTRVLIHV